MAGVLKRSKAIIHREIKRNFFSDECMLKCDGYFGAVAHLMAADRRATERRQIRYPGLLKKVVERLKYGWTPEQIGNRMISGGAKLRICQETIYRHIYSKEGMADELWWYLLQHRKYRKPRRARKRLLPKFDLDVSILFRPDDVAYRRQFGQWDADLMRSNRILGGRT